MRYNKKDLRGQIFGRLLVLDESPQRKNEKIMWLCQCECGSIIAVRGGSLKEGNTQSCGCLRNETIARFASKYFKTHGYGLDNPIYRAWAHMKNRCYNPNNQAYKYYGAKGIKVCAEWRKNFPAFRQWAVDNGHSEHLDIHRLDNARSYSPSNCTWLTRSEHTTLHHKLRRDAER